jgi:hypothetical protein
MITFMLALVNQFLMETSGWTRPLGKSMQVIHAHKHAPPRCGYTCHLAVVTSTLEKCYYGTALNRGVRMQKNDCSPNDSKVRGN